MIINNGKKPTAGRHISCTHSDDGGVDIYVPRDATEEFKLMVRRAINTWPDKSYEIAHFAERLLIDKFPTVQTELPLEPPSCQGHPETCNCPLHG